MGLNNKKTVLKSPKRVASQILHEFKDSQSCRWNFEHVKKQKAKDFPSKQLSCCRNLEPFFMLISMHSKVQICMTKQPRLHPECPGLKGTQMMMNNN